MCHRHSFLVNTEFLSVMKPQQLKRGERHLCPLLGGVGWKSACRGLSLVSRFTGPVHHLGQVISDSQPQFDDDHMWTTIQSVCPKRPISLQRLLQIFMPSEPTMPIAEELLTPMVLTIIPTVTLAW